MSPFMRIKNHVINLQHLTYVYVGHDYIDFGFGCPGEGDGQNHIRFQKGSDLKDSEFDEVKEFVMQLPDPDRVIAV